MLIWDANLMAVSSGEGPTLSTGAIREHLSRVLASPLFERGPRQSAFLRFIVERTLDGRQEEIKEYEIAVRVYERREDHSTRTDPIVRVEAARLRSKLREYYANEGALEPLRIELPKGTYVPEFVASDVPALAVAGPPSGGTRLFWVTAGLAVTVLLIGGWLFSLPPSGSPARAPGSKVPQSIAVLPLQLTSPAAGHSELGEHVTESLMAELQQFSMPNWHVRQQVMRVAPSQKPAADAVFHGAIQLDRDQVRVNGSLEQVSSGLVLWNGSLERELTSFPDESALAQNLAFSLAEAMNVALMARYEQELSAVFPDRAQARYEWLAAEELWRRSDPESVRKSLPLLERACRLDPNFAWAHASLAHAYLRALSFGLVSDQPYRDRAREESAKALRIGPYLGFAHAAAARIELLLDWDFQAASARCAISLGYLSSTGTVRNQCATVFSLAERYEPSDRLSRGTLVRMPDNVIALSELAASHYRRSRFEDAADFSSRAMRLRPHAVDAREIFILASLEKGAFDTALQAAREGQTLAGESARFSALAALSLARQGRRDEAAKELARAEQIAGNSYAGVFLIRPYLALQNQQQAGRYLQEALHRRHPALLEMRLDPLVKELDTRNLFDQIRKLVRT